jgi:inner membrane protein
MPLPLGHIAIALATHQVSTGRSALHRWKHFFYVAVLANLPDIDVLFGLILSWNGNAFHRGPTHSLAFALIAGLAATAVGKRWCRISGISFTLSTLIVLSHLLADQWLTDSPVSFFWPFEVNWSSGHAGWGDVFHSVLFQGLQDVGIVLACLGVIILHYAFVHLRFYWRLSAEPARRSH